MGLGLTAWEVAGPTSLRRAGSVKMRGGLLCARSLNGGMLSSSLSSAIAGLGSHLPDRAEVPVFGFENQHAAPRMHDHKIRARLLGADRHVVPKQIVVFQFLLEPFSQSSFARTVK